MSSMHSEITSYVNDGDVARVTAALVALAGREGRVASPRPAHVRYVLDPSDGWNFAVLPGAPGWTVVHAQPWNLLSDPSAAGPMRFVELCAALGARGFVIDTVDQGFRGEMLVETDGRGSCRLSGFYFSPDGGDPSYHGAPLDEPATITFDLFADLESAAAFEGGDTSLGLDSCMAIAHEVGGTNGETYWSSGEDFSGAWDELQEAMSSGEPPADDVVLLHFHS